MICFLFTCLVPTCVRISQPHLQRPTLPLPEIHQLVPLLGPSRCVGGRMGNLHQCLPLAFGPEKHMPSSYGLLLVLLSQLPPKGCSATSAAQHCPARAAEPCWSWNCLVPTWEHRSRPVLGSFSGSTGWVLYHTPAPSDEALHI